MSSSDKPVHKFTRQIPFLERGRLHPFILDSDVIYYLAGSLTPAVAEREPQRVAADQRDLRGLLQALRETGHRPMVVFASSGGTVYDADAPPPYREESPTRPSSVYGTAKLLQENELIASRDWTTPVILRLANVYGPGQNTGPGYGVISNWMKALLEGRAIRIFGHPEARRDYVHVADVTAAMSAVRAQNDHLRATVEPTVLNVGSGTPTSLNDLHRHLEQVVGRRIDVEIQPSRAFDRKDVWLRIERITRTVGWKPDITLSEGLAHTWRSFSAFPEPFGYSSG